RAVITTSGGGGFKTVGDAIYAALPRALDAGRAAVDGQWAVAAELWGTSTALQGRVALHSGGVEGRNGGDFVLQRQPVVRLFAGGHGGQILVSAAAQELVREQLTPELTLRHLGRYQLKDLSVPQHIFQLVAPTLVTDFPPLRLTGERAVDEPPLALPLF